MRDNVGCASSVLSRSEDDLEHEALLFRKFLKQRGLKCSFKRCCPDGVTDGYLITIVDPVDPSDVCFCRFYSGAELRLIRHSSDIFWRYL